MRPLSALLLRKPTPGKGPIAWFFRKFNAFFDWVIDRYGRIVSTSDNISGAARDLAYTYDAAGNRTSIRHVWDNRTFSYDYSAGGQFNRIRDPGSLTLVDPATSERVDLESFGPTNAAVFAQLLAAR